MIMKKTIITLLAVITCLVMASSVFAAITINTGNTTAIGGANFVPSTNVSVCPYAISTAYCASSVHKSSTGPSASGGREWSTYTAGATAIYYKDATTLPAGSECEACNDSATLPGGNNIGPTNTWKPQ